MTQPLRVMGWLMLVLTAACLRSCASANRISSESLTGLPDLMLGWPMLEVQMTTLATESGRWTRPGLAVEGTTLRVSGKATFREQPKTWKYDLREYGLQRTDLPHLRAVWVNPDETTEAIPIMVMPPDTQEAW